MLTLFARADGCHLCDEAAAVVAPIAAHLGLTFESIDITTKAALFDRYQFDIPVVVYEGLEVGRGRIVAAAFEARLRDAIAADEAAIRARRAPKRNGP